MAAAASGSGGTSDGSALVLRGHSDWVNALAALPDDRLASGSDDKTIKLWAPETGQCTETLDNWFDVNALALLPEGCLASGCDTGHIHLWDPRNGQYVRTFHHSHQVCALTSLLSEGHLSSAGEEGEIKVWDVATGRCLRTLTHNTNSVLALAALPEGLLASGSWDNTVKLWLAGTGECVHTLAGHWRYVNALAPLPGGVLASGAEDERILLWDTKTGKFMRELVGHSGPVFALAPLSGGLLASGSGDNMVKLWDTASGQCMRTLTGHSNYVRALAELPEGVLASASQDKTIRLWNLGPLKSSAVGGSSSSVGGPVTSSAARTNSSSRGSSTVPLVPAFLATKSSAVARDSGSSTGMGWVVPEGPAVRAARMRSSSSSAAQPASFTLQATRTGHRSDEMASAQLLGSTLASGSGLLGPVTSSAAGADSSGGGSRMPFAPATRAAKSTAAAGSSGGRPGPRPSSAAGSRRTGMGLSTLQVAQAGNITLEPEIPVFNARLPRCWTTEGLGKPYAKKVELGTEEYVAVCDYFYGCGGAHIPGCQVTRVLRNENRRLYHRYAACRDTQEHGINEKWLWHGTAAIAEVVHAGQGLVLAFNNDKLGALGFGFYAARDLRLSDFFAEGRAVQPTPGKTRAVLLLRVAVGRCTEKKRILDGVPKEDDGKGPYTEAQWHEEMRKVENRKAPDGFDCCVYLGTHHELCWYKEPQSFPAYVVEYTSTQLAGDPYQPPLCHELLPIMTDPSDFTCICRLPVPV